jgi:hypothetical protein
LNARLRPATGQAAPDPRVLAPLVRVPQGHVPPVPEPPLLAPEPHARQVRAPPVPAPLVRASLGRGRVTLRRRAHGHPVHDATARNRNFRPVEGHGQRHQGVLLLAQVPAVAVRPLATRGLHRVRQSGQASRGGPRLPPRLRARQLRRPVPRPPHRLLVRRPTGSHLLSHRREAGHVVSSAPPTRSAHLHAARPARIPALCRRAPQRRPAIARRPPIAAPSRMASARRTEDDPPTSQAPRASSGVCDVRRPSTPKSPMTLCRQNCPGRRALSFEPCPRRPPIWSRGTW